MFKQLNINYIGIPFHLSFYKEKSIDEDIIQIFQNKYENRCEEDVAYAMGRVQWVRENRELLKSFEKVHFLGSHSPLEKQFYSEFESMDTGYPVKLGVKHIKLFQEIHKPHIIIDNFLEQKLDNKTKEYIIQNICQFKQL